TAALARAAELTPDSVLRQQRFLRAAEVALDLGDIYRGERLLGEIRPEALRLPDRARIRVVYDMVQAGYVREPGAVDWLVDAAVQATSEEETEVALPLLQAAASCAWWAGLGPEVRGRISAATQGVATPERDPRVLCILAMTDPESTGTTLYRTGSRTPPRG